MTNVIVRSPFNRSVPQHHTWRVSANTLEGRNLWRLRRSALYERFVLNQQVLRSFLFSLAALLLTGLAGVGYRALREPVPSPEADSADTSLSLQVERRGADLLVTWNQTALVVLEAQVGKLRIEDGSAVEQELHLDSAQLRNGRVLYTPVSKNVHVRMEMVAGSRNVKESVVAVAAPDWKAPVEQQVGRQARRAVSHSQAFYVVQVGTFRNRANAERLRDAMQAQYGTTRLVSQADNLAMWRVVVGPAATLQHASGLAERIRSDRRGETNQVLVMRIRSLPFKGSAR